MTLKTQEINSTDCFPVSDSEIAPLFYFSGRLVKTQFCKLLDGVLKPSGR